MMIGYFIGQRLQRCETLALPSVKSNLQLMRLTVCELGSDHSQDRIAIGTPVGSEHSRNKLPPFKGVSIYYKQTVRSVSRLFGRRITHKIELPAVSRPSRKAYRVIAFQPNVFLMSF